MSVTTMDAPSPSVWRRLRHTPLRDLLRGRLTGRLDLASAVGAQGLPAPLAALVLDVARRTRLTRRERVEVAEELASHFAEGLEQGVTAEALVASFGEPARAARLIRRAKKRGRPALWHAFRYASYALMSLVAAYILAGLYFLAGTPGPATDFRPRLNAVAASIAPNDRAWPLYRAALIEGKRPRELLRRFTRPPRPGEDGWSDVEAYLDRNRTMLDRLRETARRTGFGFVVGGAIDPADRELWPEVVMRADDYNEMLIGYLLPYLAELRDVARVLAMDVHRAAEQRDGERVLADVDALIAGAGFVREIPFLINDLVAFSILDTAFDAIGEVIARRPEALSDAELVRLAHRLSQVDRHMVIRLDGERMAFADIVQRAYTDDGSGDGRFTLAGVRLMTSLSSYTASSVEQEILIGMSLPVLQTVVLGRREMLSEYGRLMDALEREARLPLWERGSSEVERQVETWRASPLQMIRHLPIVIMMPAISKASEQAEFTVAERDAVLVAVCLELYRRRNGSWPATLGELVPGLLPAVPPDRRDGKPLRYRVTEEGPLLYSVGRNGVDDGGQPGTQRPWDRSIPEGDWVLWPKTLTPSSPR